MARVLLTGARGYLGSAVAAALEAAGHDWAPLDTRLAAIAPASLEADCVIHCAGALRHQPDRLQADNVDGTRHLLDGLRGPCRVLLASSRSVYGAAPGQDCDETSAPDPRDDYGRSKHAAEQLLLASGRPVLCGRLGTLFGRAPRGDCPCLPNVALRRWRQGEPVRLVAQDLAVDYLAVGDAARLLVQLSQRPWPAPVLNLPGPRRSLHALMETLAGAARRHGLAAVLTHDHPGAPAWPLLRSERLEQWLPDFRHAGADKVASAWLEGDGTG